MRRLFVAGVMVALWSVPAPAHPVGPGILAPEASGIVLNGPPESRVSKLLGRVLVVEFWASWCGPCIQTLPRLDALRSEVHAAGFGDDFEVLAVGLDERVEDARRFLSVRPVSYPVVVDTIGIARRSYGVWRMPATYLIDREGHINQIYFGDGPSFGPDLRSRVFALLRAAPSGGAVPAGAATPGIP